MKHCAPFLKLFTTFYIWMLHSFIYVIKQYLQVVLEDRPCLVALVLQKRPSQK